MTGKTTEAATLAAIEAGQGMQIWAAEAALGQALQATLKQRYSVTLRAELPAVDQGGEGAVLLLAPSPAEALCQALQGDADPAAARAKVQQDMTALLTLQRRYRQRAVLLDQSVARQHSEALLIFCGVKPEQAVQDSLQAAAGAPANAVMMVLAQARLQADPQMARLVGEFAAAALLLPGVERAVTDPDMALAVFSQDQDREEELELLRDQQRGMYEQLSALYGEKQQLEQRLEQTRGGLDSFQDQVERLEQENAMYRERLRERSEVLSTAGREIEQLEYRLTLKDKQRARKDEEVQKLKAQLHRLQTSLSYRLMAPLRGLRYKQRRG